jgi:AcrR family transcriptional regulator
LYWIEFLDEFVKDWPMARPKNQTQRREQLLDATLHAIGERGVSELRIRDIADAAGVSTGTVHYYFDDVDRLLQEVHQRASERFFGARLVIVTELDDGRDKLTALIESGLPGSADDQLVVSLYELDVHKRASQVHAALITGLYDRQVALYVGVLEVGRAQGHFVLASNVLDIAQNLVALEDAYGLHIVTGNRSLPPRRARELILSYARTATGCDDLQLGDPA